MGKSENHGLGRSKQGDDVILNSGKLVGFMCASHSIDFSVGAQNHYFYSWSEGILSN